MASAVPLFRRLCGPLARLSPVLLLSGCLVVPIPVPLPSGKTGTLATTSHAGPPVWREKGPAGKAPASSRCPEPADADAARSRGMALANAARADAGLAPLRPSPRLDRVAHGHACDMAAQGTHTHAGSDGSDLGVRMRRGGYAYRLGAENTAKGFDSPEAVVAFWLRSPGHRANILQPKAREIGLGLTRPAGDRPYWVMVMAAPR